MAMTEEVVTLDEDLLMKGGKGTCIIPISDSIINHTAWKGKEKVPATEVAWKARAKLGTMEQWWREVDWNAVHLKPNHR